MTGGVGAQDRRAKAERESLFPSFARLRERALCDSLGQAEILALIDLGQAAELVWIRTVEEADASAEVDMDDLFLPKGAASTVARQRLNAADDALRGQLEQFASSCMCEAVDNDTGEIAWRPCPEDLCERHNHKQIGRVV
jgi:hypothetical protein